MRHCAWRLHTGTSWLSWMNNSSLGYVIKRLSWKAGHAWRYNWLITSGKSSVRLLIFAIRSLASVQLAGVTHEMFLLSRIIIKSANWFRLPIKGGTYSPLEKLIHICMQAVAWIHFLTNANEHAYLHTFPMEIEFYDRLYYFHGSSDMIARSLVT